MALNNDFKIRNGLTVIDSISAGGNLSASEGFFDGNVGIGINKPTQKLQVAGNALLANGSADVNLYLGNSSYGLNLDYSAGDIFVRTNGANRLLVNNSGDVIMGNTVVNIASNFTNQKGFGYKFSTGQTEIATTADIAALTLGRNLGSDGTILDLRKQGVVIGSFGSNTTGGQTLLDISASASNGNMRFLTSGTERIRINSSGNVGIGTTSPAAKLHVSSDSGGALSEVAHFVGGGSTDDKSQISVGGNTSSALVSFGFRNTGSGFGYIANASDTEIITIDGGNERVGIGTTSPSNALDVVGHFSATSKSFLIDHPTKENKKLQYASLEGPENGVYVRGTTDKETIELPEYWSELVHEDSITVVLTPIGKKQDLFIKEKSNKLIKIGGAEGSFDYVVYGERKDIDKLEIEPLKV